MSGGQRIIDGLKDALHDPMNETRALSAALEATRRRIEDADRLAPLLRRARLYVLVAAQQETDPTAKRLAEDLLGEIIDAIGCG